MSYPKKYLSKNEEIKKSHDEQEDRIGEAFDSVESKMDSNYDELRSIIEDGLGSLESRIDSKLESDHRKTLIEKGHASDLNNVTETGVYYTNANSSNIPPNSVYGGVLLVINRDRKTLSQIHVDVGRGTLSSRSKSTGGWEDWNML